MLTVGNAIFYRPKEKAYYFYALFKVPLYIFSWFFSHNFSSVGKISLALNLIFITCSSFVKTRCPSSFSFVPGKWYRFLSTLFYIISFTYFTPFSLSSKIYYSSFEMFFPNNLYSSANSYSYNISYFYILSSK